MVQVKAVAIAGVLLFLLGNFLSIDLRAECGAAAAGVDAAMRILEQSRNFTIVLSLLRTTGIDLALQALDQVTFLAPSDGAYRLLPDGELGTLDQESILNLLRLHAVPSYLPISALDSTAPFQSFSGERISFSRPSRSSLLVRSGHMDGADVVSIVYDQSPVVVYSIDRVLLPALLVPPAPLSTPVPAILPSPAPAPSIILPSPAPAPSNFPSPVPAPAGLQRENSSFLDVLENISGFNTLVALIYSTGVDMELESLPRLTYLAPTDQAFTAVSKPLLRKLTDSQLVALLKFHGIPDFFAGFQKVVNPLATLATNGSSSRGKYLLHIQQRSTNDSSGLGIAYTGVDRTNILGPLFIHSPRLAIYAVEELLLPLELSWVSGSNITSDAPAPSPIPAEENAGTQHPAGNPLIFWILVAAVAVV